MATVKTDLPFWGARNYLQSSQLLDEFGRALPLMGVGECRKLSAKFRSFLSNQGEFYPLNDAGNQSTVCGSFSVDGGGETLSFVLAETETAVTDRAPDDEAEIIQASIVDVAAKTGEISDYDADRFYAVLVALNKRLIIELSPLENGMAWILAQIDVEAPFELASSHPALKCEVVSIIAGKIVKTKITADGKDVGYTVFTKVAKP